MRVQGPYEDEVREWLQAKGIQNCRLCEDAREGFTTQDISAIIQTGAEPLTEAALSPSVPVLPIICNNCGNTVLLHAGRMQLI